MEIRAGGGKGLQAGLVCDVGSWFVLRRVDVFKIRRHRRLDSWVGRGPSSASASGTPAVSASRSKRFPARILYSIGFVLSLGWLVFGHAGARGRLAPTEPETYEAFTTNTPMPAVFASLNPFVYMVENAVLLVRLGQNENWAPDRRHAPTDWLTGHWCLMWMRWGLILFVWFQATVLDDALSSRFER